MEQNSLKFLTFDQKVFSDKSPTLGEPVYSWSTRLEKDHVKELEVIAVNVIALAPVSPIFRNEVFRDGYTDSTLVKRLKDVMQMESARLRRQPQALRVRKIRLPNALKQLKPELIALHADGYTIDELRRLLIGSLKMQLTNESIVEVIFE